MIATDVAARGLDIRNCTIVINHDTPNNAEDYVHRIGRTGRAEDKGDAYTIMAMWGEEKKAKDIMNIMQKAGQTVPQLLLDVAQGRARAGSSFDDGSTGGGGGNNAYGGNDAWSGGGGCGGGAGGANYENSRPGDMFNLLGNKRPGGEQGDGPMAKRYHADEAVY